MTYVERVIEALRGRKRQYQLTFSQPWGQVVLQDLMIFCRANESCGIPGDHDRTWLLEGRREVWLRIQNHMKLTPDQLAAIYGGKTLEPDGGADNA